MPELVVTQTRAVFPVGHVVQWRVRNAEPGVHTFAVYRSGGPAGPWEELARDLRDTFAYVDRFVTGNAANQFAMFRSYVYRVVCVTPSRTVLEAVDELGAVAGRSMSRAARHAIYYFMKRATRYGTPTLLLKRRAWGPRCTVCTDVKTRESTRDKCLTCYGTTYVGGYWTPWPTYTLRGTGTSATTYAPTQRKDLSDTQIQFPDWPQLEKDDVLVYPADGHRFRVDSVASTEVQLQGVVQIASAQEIARDHVVYRFPVPQELDLR